METDIDKFLTKISSIDSEIQALEEEYNEKRSDLVASLGEAIFVACDEGGYSVPEIATYLSVTRQTVYRYLKKVGKNGASAS